ncbi:hypothetical protein DPMN_140410 [Dreissena polymorpha]|uniref:Heat shock factor-binding protein 1 n=2 Tax=Dreissena polymorpha TaxID=45954 RepID=A0A9D4G7J8_DREPO|nr:hypothetical protein DPMN_140410 [Dreissena polymorpha]
MTLWRSHLNVNGCKYTKSDILGALAVVIAKRNQKEARMADTGKDYISNSADPKNIQDLTSFVQNLLQQMQDKFQNMSDQIITRIDEMGNRIDDLEKNIADLMTQAGVDDRA